MICGVVWILIAPLFGLGLLFLIAFGFNGAGELMGAYYPYYVLCLSPKSQMRRNMAFVMLLSAPVGFAPALYGAISDNWSLDGKLLGGVGRDGDWIDPRGRNAPGPTATPQRGFGTSRPLVSGYGLASRRLPASLLSQ